MRNQEDLATSLRRKGTVKMFVLSLKEKSSTQETETIADENKRSLILLHPFPNRAATSKRLKLQNQQNRFLSILVFPLPISIPFQSLKVNVREK